MEFQLEQGFFSSWVALSKSLNLLDAQFDHSNHDDDDGDNNFKNVYQLSVTLC